MLMHIYIYIYDYIYAFIHICGHTGCFSLRVCINNAVLQDYLIMQVLKCEAYIIIFKCSRICEYVTITK